MAKIAKKGQERRGGDRTGMEASAYKERYHKARAEKIELDVQVRRGQLVSRHEVKLAWSNRIDEVRSAFLNMGSDLAPRLVGKKERDIKMILDKYIFHVTNKLADAEYSATKGNMRMARHIPMTEKRCKSYKRSPYQRVIRPSNRGC